jgi:hypothetical protein
MIGKVENIPPQPRAEKSATRYFPAGAITLGLEYRRVTPQPLAATYAKDPVGLAELEEESPAGGFFDQGVTIRVCGSDDGHEYLRFDCFDNHPHYHYIHCAPEGGEAVNNVVAFDAVAMGEMLPWAVERIRTRLPEMLSEAGGGHLVGELDSELVNRVLIQVVEGVDPSSSRARDPAGERLPT